jgi:hypothetical protein
MQAQSRFNLKDFLGSEDEQTPVAVAFVAAGLLVAIAIIHIQDQGGLLGDQSPTWLKWGYYLVELSSLLAALLVARKRTAGWVLGLGAAAGPFTGYVLSRSVGLPGDSGDIGNWGYTLGQVSLVVEGLFVIIACVCLVRIYQGTRPKVAERVEHRDLAGVST